MIVAAAVFYCLTGYAFASMVRIMAVLSKQRPDFNPVWTILFWPFFVLAVVWADISDMVPK